MEVRVCSYIISKSTYVDVLLVSASVPVCFLCEMKKYSVNTVQGHVQMEHVMKVSSFVRNKWCSGKVCVSMIMCIKYVWFCIFLYWLCWLVC